MIPDLPGGLRLRHTLWKSVSIYPSSAPELAYFLKAWPGEMSSGLPRTNPARIELGASGLQLQHSNHSATLPPEYNDEILISINF